MAVADLLMADVLRVPKVRAFGTARPAFRKAHADQLALFEAADATRAG